MCLHAEGNSHVFLDTVTDTDTSVGGTANIMEKCVFLNAMLHVAVAHMRDSVLFNGQICTVAGGGFTPDGRHDSGWDSTTLETGKYTTDSAGEQCLA